MLSAADVWLLLAELVEASCEDKKGGRIQIMARVCRAQLMDFEFKNLRKKCLDLGEEKKTLTFEEVQASAGDVYVHTNMHSACGGIRGTGAAQPLPAS